jgi:hypothetical protein
VRPSGPDELDSAIKTAVLAELQSQAEEGWLYFRDIGAEDGTHLVSVDGELDLNSLAAAIAAGVQEAMDAPQPPAGESPPPPVPGDSGTA